ncbi:NUDIX domain-containing protein [Streptomyces sp. NBC_01166]|uniref:NUDIX hydrolase n=1 Tax=Streptomyces sp. NBC_01166 TaxID=2903755 RepID=UPI00386BA9BF|nr:NUDIX domain-containing protein [Streptomyces sp. NBC_01166]
MSTPRIRVAAYVIRRRESAELLVFDHVGMADAGTQVPAGGVEPGEELSDAVLREVAEETGLLTADVIRPIAVDGSPHPQTRQPRRTTFFLLRAPEGSPDAWVHRVRGDGVDAGLTFACRFEALPLRRSLADGQDAWLGNLEL